MSRGGRRAALACGSRADRRQREYAVARAPASVFMNHGSQGIVHDRPLYPSRGSVPGAAPLGGCAGAGGHPTVSGVAPEPSVQPRGARGEPGGPGRGIPLVRGTGRAPTRVARRWREPERRAPRWRFPCVRGLRAHRALPRRAGRAPRLGGGAAGRGLLRRSGGSATGGSSPITSPRAATPCSTSWARASSSRTRCGASPA